MSAAHPTNGKRAAGPVLGAATVATALMAGVFFSFDVAVIPGLSRGDDRTFIGAMQNINVAIENPVFFLAFFGALVLTGVAAFQQRRLGRRAVFGWVLASVALYVVALLVTMGGNIPLNDELAKAGDPAHIGDPTAVLDRFENTWIALNIVRTTVCTVAVGCLGRALFLHGRGDATAHTG
ncbi:anthrone oxygenase family protein [Streptomyces sp. SPB162]|uniref:anthrone oxygenase family protein n=1 Tax=Streptomyces sp. SPB162 TaxID=2940560 RepID=UPI002404EFCB|nr:anthrone oxygenase family protein [Streptomyces sp. SPB162]MDF9811300.1 putative membrane protein [Streptomyces sp. SPB162]